MVQVWFRPDSGMVQVWFRSGSGLVQAWFRYGSGLVQVLFIAGSCPFVMEHPWTWGGPYRRPRHLEGTAEAPKAFGAVSGDFTGFCWVAQGEASLPAPVKECRSGVQHTQ